MKTIDRRTLLIGGATAMKALLSTGYDDALSLEIFNDQFRSGSAHSVAIDGHRSLRFMTHTARAAARRCTRGSPTASIAPGRS